MISVRKTRALLTAVIVLLALASTSPVSAQEDPAGSAQYPGDGGPMPVQDVETPGPVDEPPGAQPSQYPPDEAETPPEDECDPAYEECEPDDTGYFVGDAAGDSQQTSDTLDGEEDSAPVPAGEPAAVPEQYPPGTDPEIDAAPRPLVPRPAPGYSEGGPAPPAPPIAPPSAEPSAGVVPGQEAGTASQSAPEAETSAEEPRNTGEAAPQGSSPPAGTREVEQAEEAGRGRTEPEVGRERTAAEPREDAAGREEVRAPRPAGTTARELAEQKPATGSGGVSTLYTLGGSALLIAGAAAVGRFLKR